MNSVVRGFAKNRPGWVRGPRPTWGRGARFVRWAFDVGLDPLVLSCQEERTSVVHRRRRLRIESAMTPRGVRMVVNGVG